MRNKLYDDFFCMDVEPEMLPWLEAVEAADSSEALRKVSPPWKAQKKETKGHATRLAQLLRSTEVMPREARELIADLLERHLLKPKPGGQRIPIYTRSISEGSLEGAAADFKIIRKMNAYIDDDDDKLLGDLSKEYDLKPSKQGLRNKELMGQKLRNYIEGKRGASRRRR